MKAKILTGKHAGREVEIVKQHDGYDPPKYLVSIEIKGTTFKFTYPKRSLRFDHETELAEEMREQRENGVELSDPKATYQAYSSYHLATGDPVTEDEVRSAFRRKYNRNPREVTRVTGHWWAGPLTKEEVQT